MYDIMRFYLFMLSIATCMQYTRWSLPSNFSVRASALIYAEVEIENQWFMYDKWHTLIINLITS